MTREQFDINRGAFNRYMDCVEGSTGATQCAAGWADSISSLTGSDERTRAMARGYAEYYVGMLREHAGKSVDCLTR